MLSDFFVAVIKVSDAYKGIFAALVNALQQAQKGRLALARTPDNGKNFSGVQLEVDALEQLLLSGKDIQVFDFDIESERQVLAGKFTLRKAHGAAGKADCLAFAQLNHATRFTLCVDNLVLEANLGAIGMDPCGRSFGNIHV